MGAANQAVRVLSIYDKVAYTCRAKTGLAYAISTDSDIYEYDLASGSTTNLCKATANSTEMGGYDIFMSTFDLDKGVFYSPENIGLPFNSTANDYLLAIDDINHLGWLVTDRRQPEDKVCIYTFVPTASRQGFEDTNLTNVEIERYSRILSIADTWKLFTVSLSFQQRLS